MERHWYNRSRRISEFFLDGRVGAFRSMLAMIDLLMFACSAASYCEIPSLRRYRMKSAISWSDNLPFLNIF